jgi:hypothetical protein
MVLMECNFFAAAGESPNKQKLLPSDGLARTLATGEKQ